MMETTLENVRTSDCFQTLGHLDYVVRYGKSREKNIRIQIMRIL